MGLCVNCLNCDLFVRMFRASAQDGLDSRIGYVQYQLVNYRILEERPVGPDRAPRRDDHVAYFHQCQERTVSLLARLPLGAIELVDEIGLLVHADQIQLGHLGPERVDLGQLSLRSVR